MIDIRMQPTDVHKLSPKITVIGVGGAGGNAVNNMISSNLEGCEFLVCNTDAQALENSLAQHKLQLGVNVTGGLGAGSKPEVGKAAAQESLDEVLQYLEGANMVFVTAGMGGGTGTGAAPEIAKACRERGILTVGVVTKPFHFEGAHRMRMAEAGIEEMQQYVDTLIVIPNQNLFRVANEKTTFAEAFRMADSVLQSGVRGVTDLMVRPGLVNLDFADIRTAMLEMGKAMMGTGEAEGDKRAVEAAESAINNPLLDDVSMKGAQGVIINVTGGYDMTLFEADEACNRIRDEVDPNANIIFGATFDESLEGIMRVSIVATGIEKEAAQKNKPQGKSGTSGGQGGKTFERAQPNTAAAASHQQQQPISQGRLYGNPQGYGGGGTKPYVTGAESIKGIRAPSENVAPAQQPAPQQRADEPEAEADMFDQGRFSNIEAEDHQTALPRNTALRGERYKDSFIPPKPITAEDDSQMPRQANPAPRQGSFHHNVPQQQQPQQPQAQQRQPQQSSGLTLNPPRKPQPQQHVHEEAEKKTPSLFERITGTVQRSLEGGRHHDEPRQQPQGNSSPQFDQPIPKRAAQGQLDIATPAAKPRREEQADLDIPAFLRRQAN